MPRTFYNPKKSALTISLSYEKKWGILEIAQSMNPNAGGKAQKGSKIFDWNNKLIFAIGPEEAPILMKFMKGMIQKDHITLNHSPTGNTRQNITSLTISGRSPYINITISKTESNNKRKITFTLRSTETMDEIAVFYKFLEKIVELPFIEDYMKSLVKFSIDYRKELETKSAQQSQRYYGGYNYGS